MTLKTSTQWAFIVLWTFPLFSQPPTWCLLSLKVYHTEINFTFIRPTEAKLNTYRVRRCVCFWSSSSSSAEQCGPPQETVREEEKTKSNTGGIMKSKTMHHWQWGSSLELKSECESKPIIPTPHWRCSQVPGSRLFSSPFKSRSNRVWTEATNRGLNMCFIFLMVDFYLKAFFKLSVLYKDINCWLIPV